MFRHIKNRILFSYFLVLLSSFLAVLVIASLFLRNAYFSYALNDLKEDAGLFIDDFTREAITNNDMDLLKKILMKAEKDYTIEIFAPKGNIAVSSEGDYAKMQDLSRKEFQIIPSRGYGYAVRQEANRTKIVYVAVPIMKEGTQIGFVRIFTPLSAIEQTVTRLKIYVAIIFILALMAALPVSVFLSQGISSPLLKMAKVAKKVSSGNLSERIDLKNRVDEIGALAAAFNEMIKRLKRGHEEKKALIENMSHELMTPITAIRGFAETLYEGKINDKKRIGECLEAIKGESEYLEQLIEELRLISQIDALSLKYDFRPVNIVEIIADAEKSLLIKAMRKNIDLVNDFSKGRHEVKGDYTALKEVFINLLDNAIKYSPPGRKVTVSIRRRDALIEITVKDEGIGIRPEEKEKIFERFYRGKDKRQQDKGLGLGLSIVKEILEAHRSLIRFESRINKGSQFIVTLPAM